MVNYFTIETEAEFRRQDWQRAIEAEIRAAQAQPSSNGGSLRSILSHLPLPSLRSLGAARLPFATPLAARRRAPVG
jgi:hypothetical protein